MGAVNKPLDARRSPLKSITMELLGRIEPQPNEGIVPIRVAVIVGPPVHLKVPGVIAQKLDIDFVVRAVTPVVERSREGEERTNYTRSRNRLEAGLVTAIAIKAGTLIVAGRVRLSQRSIVILISAP
jgi:hypothetical protein